MTRPILTPDALDAMLEGKLLSKPEKLWGAPAIAVALGVSEDTVREWAKDPEVPIYRPKGYFARRSELEIWLRRKP
ncbi:hypothetical protein GB928_018645 [Shinella curvata]|uniref:Helix-turn-helix domain-containing protein n=1 Tax=Shinella curvata TaxID=1817964 RepID=A0ABT8XHP9_9HYPH|nr:hypothetical protein [Shinella curvata]MCJ8053879.1 hypothetical protein [Shinella curvata]MDO6123211.1 hypothetical protein [Shinella curvata]